MKQYQINGKTFSLEQIAAIFPHEQLMLTHLSIMPVGEVADDCFNEAITRLPDAPDGITLALTTDQLATIIHALGIASDQFVKLSATCHAMGNTRHTQDPALRDAGNAYTQRACDLVDLMLVLREGAK
jgi:hypothetical protein